MRTVCPVTHWFIFVLSSIVSFSFRKIVNENIGKHEIKLLSATPVHIWNICRLAARTTPGTERRISNLICYVPVLRITNFASKFKFCIQFYRIAFFHLTYTHKRGPQDCACSPYSSISCLIATLMLFVGSITHFLWLWQPGCKLLIVLKTMAAWMSALQLLGLRFKLRATTFQPMMLVHRRTDFNYVIPCF